MKKCLNCEKEYEPLGLPPSPVKTFLGYPDKLQDLCPLCALEFCQGMSSFAFHYFMEAKAKNYFGGLK